MKWARDIRLLVNDTELTGWDRWEVESDLLQPVDAFSLSAENKAGRLATGVRPGDAFKLTLDGVVTMQGYIDETFHDTTNDGARLEVNGRDGFAPLADCSATPGTHKSVTLLVLAQKLSAPWSISWSLSNAPTMKTHKSVKVDPGESILDVLLRVAEKERVALWYSSDGTGYIGRPDYTLPSVHKLRLYLPASGRTSENNVTSSRVARSWRDRYSSITVAGTGANDANAWGRTSHRRYTITDTGVSSSRPLIMVGGDVRTLDQAKTMATLEKQRRARDAVAMEYTVPGHYGTPAQPGFQPTLYQPGDGIDLVDEPAGIAGTTKVVLLRRRFILDTDGPSTSLSVYPAVWMAP